MAGRQMVNELGLLQTTSGAQAEAFAFPMPEDSAAEFLVEVSAASTSVVTASWRIEGAVKRVGSGDAAFVGGDPSGLLAGRKDVAAALWTVDVDTDGADLRVLVSGAAATTIEWIVRVTGIVNLPLA
jgi:hypothetical protein